MHRSTLSVGRLATPFVGRRHDLGERSGRCLQDLVRLVEDFLDQRVTPAAMCQFERALQKLLQRFGRTTLEWTVNQLEPEELPAQVCLAGEC